MRGKKFSQWSFPGDMIPEKNIILNMDRDILKKVCSGILKNAIENTPDEGEIEITARSEDGEIRIDFHDYGVGITPQNQKMILQTMVQVMQS